MARTRASTVSPAASGSPTRQVERLAKSTSRAAERRDSIVFTANQTPPPRATAPTPPKMATRFQRRSLPRAAAKSFVGSSTI
jgi:hypothetical protein